MIINGDWPPWHSVVISALLFTMTEDLIKMSREVGELSDAYYKASLEAGEIAERSGVGWLELRRECKTDKECDRKWDCTADGKRANYLRFYLKGLEKKISSIKLELRMLTGVGA